MQMQVMCNDAGSADDLTNTIIIVSSEYTIMTTSANRNYGASAATPT